MHASVLAARTYERTTAGLGSNHEAASHTVCVNNGGEHPSLQALLLLLTGNVWYGLQEDHACWTKELYKA